MLEKEDKKLIEAIVLVTGRDLELINNLTHDANKMQIINELLQSLRSAGLKEERFELMNRISLTLGIPPMSKKFFEKIFRSTDFKDTNAINACVNRIRCVYLLEYGNFYYGYRKLRDNTPSSIISKYFSTEEEKEKLIAHYQKKKSIPAFQPIAVAQRYCLGYLASKESKEVNGYREKLIQIIEEAIKEGIKDPEGLKKIAENKGRKNWDEIVLRSALDYGTDLLYWGTLFAHHYNFGSQKYSSFRMLMQDAKDACIKLEPQHIENIRKLGRKNSYAYLSTSEIDIYFATSMRKALDFVSNARFVEEVIGILKKEGFSLLYFDPTQSYLDDRIQKGLIESIMIKRCKIVVYNAQEQETFGKDAEAGIGLSHQKHVIIYVPSILPDNKELRDFYDILDTAGYEKEPLGEELQNAGYLSGEEYYKFIAPETEKIEAIKGILSKSEKLKKIFEKIEDNELKGELASKGYDPTDPKIKSDIKKFSFEKMLGFESRALLFKDLHPLGFQISPQDGIARGVFVTRTPKETANLIESLLLKILEYEVIGDDETEGESKKYVNYLLIDKITKSPIRALPTDISLRIALSRLYEEEK
jgi:hypothetical protein